MGISLDCSLEPTISSVIDNGTSLTAAHSKDKMALKELIGNASNQIITLSTDSDGTNPCKINILQLHVAFLILWSFALLVEVALICVSLRGGILQDQKRWPAEYLLYVKLGKIISIKVTIALHLNIPYYGFTSYIIILLKQFLRLAQVSSDRASNSPFI